MKLEERLNESLISFTNKVLHFPCRANRPKTEYPNFYHFNFRKGHSEERFDTLYIPVYAKSYTEILQNIYEGFTGEKKVLSEFNQREHFLLSKIYRDNLEQIRNLQKTYW